MQRLRVHPQGRYLMTEDGTPFFYLGDTAWELFHRLTREEALHYLTTRQKQGFRVIQAVILAEFEGLTVPNAYGRLPLRMGPGGPDPLAPDLEGPYSYWDHVDFVVAEAERRGLYVALLPTWGDKYNLAWGKGPVIFDSENARAYGRFVGERYRDAANVLWMLGGDRPLETPEHCAIVDAMARGLGEGDGGTHLITFHPSGGCSSADFVADRDYMDFHTVQSGHHVDAYDSWRLLRRTARKEDKPFMDAEPRYEDHPACFDASLGYYWDADDVRQNLYWDLMEGVCGHTYGNHCIWSFHREPSDYYPYAWTEALEHPGAWQAALAVQLRMCRDYFSFRPAPELVEDDGAVMAHIAAGRGTDYAYIYTPLGQPIRAQLQRMEGKILRASWFDPRTGEEKPFAILPARETLLVPPTQGKGQDWVCVIDIVGR